MGKKKPCLTAQYLMAQWNGEQHREAQPGNLKEHLEHYRHVRPVACLQKKGKHQQLRIWSAEVNTEICLWCNPTLATGQGRLILSWLQPKRRAIIEDLLAQGDIIPGPWGKGDE